MKLDLGAPDDVPLVEDDKAVDVLVVALDDLPDALEVVPALHQSVDYNPLPGGKYLHARNLQQ